MRLVLQRVSHASVTVEDKIVGAIQQGFLVLVGLCHGDTVNEAKLLAEKLVNLRVFEDAEGKMNLSLREVKGAVLLVSQFTLYANCQKGRRPSFQEAMTPSDAKPLFDMFCDIVRGLEVPVQTGVFGASMQVALCNQGPVTILLDSAELLRGR